MRLKQEKEFIESTKKKVELIDEEIRMQITKAEDDFRIQFNEGEEKESRIKRREDVLDKIKPNTFDDIENSQLKTESNIMKQIQSLENDIKARDSSHTEGGKQR